MFVPVNILHDLGKEAVGRLPDLMRRSVIDLESARTCREYRYYVVPIPMPDADTVDPLAAEMDRALQ
ncbi:hypothetical protein [Methylocystis sp. SB2]|uniref:hypothetical protein n=1 Tax=Methylocystis sp. (strain SB2) TaxID=743836 RepID=UPI00041E6BC9|nr:hypothetical protein [Methylocystis sp. SB2]ULO25106.1 hypothetical protein LNB28_06880 [Methylocystis sp. SB2]